MAGTDNKLAFAQPKTTQVLLLEFGASLYSRGRRRQADPDPTRIAEAEAQLIEQLSNEKGSTLKSALNVTVSNPVDPIMLRILAIVAYAQLCTDNSAVAVSTTANSVAGDDPAAVLAARKTISHLLLTKRLLMRPDSNGCVELGRELIDFLSGGKSEPPILLSEYELHQRWKKIDSQAAKRRAAEMPDLSVLPSAKQIAERIQQTVVGMDPQVKTIASRLALHLRRAALIRHNHDPGCSNECLMLIGPSGAGKTFLAETAGKACGVPFSSISASDLTSEAYVGLSCSDILKSLITAAGGNVEQAVVGLALVDEIDKKAVTPGNWKDVGGVCVQQELLRMMEGCDVQVGGRRSTDYSNVVNFNTRSTCFFFAGAFVGLEVNKKDTKTDIGFGAQPGELRHKSSLYQALEAYGMLPEFLNRLSAVLVIPEPTLEQLFEIAVRSVLPAYNRLLATYKAEVVIRPDALDLIVSTALGTGTYARGIKSIVGKLTEEIAYEAQPGSFLADTALVRRAIEGVGLG